MDLVEVKTQKDIQDFLNTAPVIYKNDKNWIRPLDKDIEAVFDKKKNKLFRHGEATRWILKRDGQLIGRVAAFINRKTAKTGDQPTGGMGFFECVDNKEAAFKLFDIAKQWLQEKGMEAMEGPINFGEKDRFWGLLVEGFSEPVYCMNYNLPYYQALFERYGFRNYYEQFYYLFKVTNQIPEKYRDRSERIMRDPQYRSEHIKKDQLKKYTEDFRTIYNKAWGKHDGFKGMSKEQANAIISTIKPIMDEDIIWFVYYNNEPIAFFIMLPEINQIFKHINNGKLRWIEMLKFLYYKWRGVCRKMYGVAFGVVPEFQSRGVEGYIIMEAARHIQPMNKYDDFEMTWIGDFNPRMIHLVESVGAEKFRTAITYRKLFDESKDFKRAPIIT